MATLGSRLLVKEMEWNANMTEQSHLGAALIAKPHRILGEMDKLFSAQNYYSDNPISSLLMGNSKTEETIGNTEWEWELKGANTRPLVVVENVEDAGNLTPGKFKKTFKSIVSILFVFLIETTNQKQKKHVCNHCQHFCCSRCCQSGHWSTTTTNW